MGLASLCLISTAAAQTAEGDAPAGSAPGPDFHSTMDRVFGPGQWRQTSGYRTPAQEDALRRQGAGTVPAGRLSHHSMGGPDAPGAYDAVVPGMSSANAAAKLRRSGEGFTRIVAEGAHGGQGAHLHIEPGARTSRAASTRPEETVYLRIVGGERNPVIRGAHSHKAN